MSRRRENTGFLCENCGREVTPLTNGSYRNHCPYCLHSKHVDITPGDRSSDCGGIMKPMRVIQHSKKGLQITHICTKCGKQSKNIIAENTTQSDNFEQILMLIN